MAKAEWIPSVNHKLQFSLYYDADGSGADARIGFVSLTGIPALTSADFMVV